jgi:predicted aspartyl protease
MSKRVPFRLAGGGNPLVLVPTHVGGRGPYDFILDTGSAIVLLTPELASELNVAIDETREARGAGGAVQVSLGVVDSIAIGNREQRNVAVGITADLHRISQAIGAHVDGNLGFNYLRHYTIELDYQDSTIGFISGDLVGARPGRATIPFRLASPDKPLIVVPVFVNGTGPHDFVLDTGASATVLSLELANRLNLKSTTAPGMTAGGGGVQALTGLLDSFSVAGLEVRQLPVVASGFLQMLSDAVGTGLDGVVGYNFLRHYLVAIDYPNELLYLTPRRADR